MIEPGIVAYLGSQLPSLKLHAGGIPQTATFPCVHYETIAQRQYDRIGGYAGLSDARIQLHCWGLGLTPADAQNTAESLRLKLNGFSGTMGSVSVERCLQINRFTMPAENTGNNSDHKYHRVVVEYSVLYREPIPNL